MSEQSPPRAGAAALVETDLVDALAAFPEELERIVLDRSTEDLTRPASDGGWGVVENLCHLRDWEAIFLRRTRALLDEDTPLLPAFDDELWAIERDYRGSDPRRALATLRGDRAALLDLLRDLPATSWERRGRHERLGEVTLRTLIEGVRKHDAEHLLQIREALA